MVGLRILLEAANHHKNNTNNKGGGVGQQPHVLCKTMSLKSTLPSPLSYPSSPLPPITFLDACYLCRKRLLPEKDIYMYKGDRAFCSVECRYRQILMDEENVKRDKCSLAAMKPSTITTTCSSSTGYQHNNKKPTTTINSKNIKKNRLGGFAY